MKDQTNHPHYNPQLLEQVARNFPEFSREQHAKMVGNIDPSLLTTPHQYQQNILKESSGVKVKGEGELEMRKSLEGYFANKRKIELTEEQKEKNQAYIKKVKAIPTIPSSLIPKPPKKLLIEDLEKAKRGVWELYKKEIGATTPIKDPYTLQILKNLTLYFIQHPSSPLNLDKGLFIFGGVGVGKTILFKTFSKFCFKHQLPNRFSILKTATLIKDVLDHKKKDAIDNATYSIQMIDDLGEEAGLVEWYNGSNKGVNLLKRVLDRRYEKFKASGLLTHVSSNIVPGKNDLGENELERLYGERLSSRFKEMFNVVFYDGGDKRK